MIFSFFQGAIPDDPMRAPGQRTALLPYSF
jgi:hypothetical protein